MKTLSKLLLRSAEEHAIQLSELLDELSEIASVEGIVGAGDFFYDLMNKTDEIVVALHEGFTE